MKLAQSLKSTTVFVRRFGTAPPPVVPTAAELAQNDEIIANYRKLNHTSGKLCFIFFVCFVSFCCFGWPFGYSCLLLPFLVTPKFMGHDMVPSAKYIQEPVSVGDIHALSGVPADQINRTVRVLFLLGLIFNQFSIVLLWITVDVVCYWSS